MDAGVGLNQYPFSWEQNVAPSKKNYSSQNDFLCSKSLSLIYFKFNSAMSFLYWTSCLMFIFLKHFFTSYDESMHLTPTSILQKDFGLEKMGEPEMNHGTLPQLWWHYTLNFIDVLPFPNTLFSQLFQENLIHQIPSSCTYNLRLVQHSLLFFFSPFNL
jgi:hypothetical protein